MSEPEHDVIFLEPEPPGDEEYGRLWCQHDVWQEPGTRYLLATSAREVASELLALCVEFLPILERLPQSINPGGAAEGSAAYQTAKARVDRMRSAVAKGSLP